MRVKLPLYMIMITALLLGGCDKPKEQRYTTVVERIQAQEKAYVDFKRFKEGRPCGEVRFICLPESLDKHWQSVPTKDHIEDLELTKEVNAKYDAIAKAWNERYDAYHAKTHPKGEKEPMLITSLDKDFFDKVDERRFLEEMEQELEKEFPGFWRDVPKKVRYRWIRRAMSKAKKFGYDPKLNNSMVELCARIGLDFDLNPKWEHITKFIAINELNIGSACDYIDFTVFEKDYSPDGDKYTDWYLKEALSYLPKPKRPVPKLHENRR